MRLVNVMTVLFLLSASSAYAEEKADVVVEPRHAVIQVDGIVCSFCAYGAEKELSKLDCLDKSKFGDGVLIDINTGQITLALAPEKQIPFGDIYQTIKKAGYDPVAMYVRIQGQLEETEHALILRSAASGQAFALQGDALAGLSEGEEVDVQAHFDARKIPSFDEAEPVEVIVDKRYGAGG